MNEQISDKIDLTMFKQNKAMIKVGDTVTLAYVKGYSKGQCLHRLKVESTGEKEMTVSFGEKRYTKPYDHFIKVKA